MARVKSVGYLGLGSNIGDRRTNLQAAVDLLPNHGVQVLASSSVYETEPVGEVLEQRDFFNVCLRVSTELEPEELLDVCKEVEKQLGRSLETEKHGPRQIDVDLLLLGESSYSSSRLQIPHRDLTNRRFVILPLLELDAGLTLPDGKPLSEVLSDEAIEKQRVDLSGPSLKLNS